MREIHKSNKNLKKNDTSLSSILGNQAYSAEIVQCTTVPVRVNYTNGKYYEQAALNDLLNSSWTLKDMQVPITPNPTPTDPAPSPFIADFYMRSPNGTDYLIEAKYTSGGNAPRLTANQSRGYPAVAAAGGTITGGPCRGPIGATPGVLMNN